MATTVYRNTHWCLISHVLTTRYSVKKLLLCQFMEDQ